MTIVVLNQQPSLDAGLTETYIERGHTVYLCNNAYDVFMHVKNGIDLLITEALFIPIMSCGRILQLPPEKRRMLPVDRLIALRAVEYMVNEEKLLKASQVLFYTTMSPFDFKCATNLAVNGSVYLRRGLDPFEFVVRAIDRQLKLLQDSTPVTA